jgi:hypothetical protein
LPTITPTSTQTATPTLPSFEQFNATYVPQLQPQATATPFLSYPTSTPLPPNPASLTTASIFTVFWQSALLVLGLFLLFSLILRLRKNT